MVKALIHHAEIGLKKGNFAFFEKKLIENIKKSAYREGVKIKEIIRHEKRILANFDATEKKISDFLRNVFGIKYFSFVHEVDRDLKKLEKEVENKLKKFKKNKIQKIAFQTKRSDKGFSLNSLEINKKLGEISNKIGLKVDYKNFEKKIFIEITLKKIYVYVKKINGLGGLPVGTSGRVLVLFSGGIDSPVASWLMMKRGCRADFLHFHAFRNNKQAFNSKINNLVKKLKVFQGASRLYLVPYSTYSIFTQGEIQEKYDLVLFKHFMLKFAERLAKENHYDAIVLGDNLGQVASQTIENIKASSLGLNAVIFRPLLTYDKQEIIDLSKKIGTYEMSIKKYKDCCSIISRKPSTKTKLKAFENVLEKININMIVEKSLKELEGFEVE
ncbi:MAG: tRNA 4-thiouridine(8) synthase ThiI [Nanoarchaeota archaeon]|nr:tRNA 4-thiouridine(8) synthase ThiI [Nanoarchaeota archaeon]